MTKKSKIIELLSGGTEPMRVAELVGCSRAHVYKTIRGTMDPSSVQWQRTKADPDAVVREYESGKTIRSIAESMGISQGSVYRYLRQRNAHEPIERRAEVRRAPRLKAVVRALFAGMSCDEIREEVGIKGIGVALERAIDQGIFHDMLQEAWEENDQ